MVVSVCCHGSALCCDSQFFMMDGEQERSSTLQLKEQIRLLTDENEQLREQNKRLSSKLGSVQNKVAQEAASRREMSSSLVQSQQKNLQISRDLLEVQIDSNKMREKYEEEIFELKNKVLQQQGVVSSLEAELERARREAQSARVQCQAAEDGQSEAQREHQALKHKFLLLSDALEREITHSEQLSHELLTLAHTHDTLLRERERTHTHTLELERVRELIDTASHSRVRPEDLARATAGDKRTNAHTNELMQEIEKLRKSYEEQQQQLTEKIVAMGKEEQETKRAHRNTQQELAQQSAALLTCQYQLKEVEAENSKLQNHLKELNQQYRARLTHYIHDITECVSVCEGEVYVRLREYVESMLKQVRVSYRSREGQLSDAVRTYRTRLHTLANTHQLLLTAYRIQREQVLAQGELEAGPPEAHFSPGEAELRGETERELQRLREDKARLETQLRTALDQVAALSQTSHRATLSEEVWTEIRKQLKDITSSTQDVQEREKLQMISRATVAEQQVCELQEYIDNHLARYKQEVTRLQRLLGLKAGRTHSAEFPKSHPLHTPLKKSSNET